ncbi:MAG: hypothetical protein ABJA67_02375 [Chthonomonadales bacterium]
MITHQPRFSKEEFARRGDEIYNLTIRPLVDNAENRGKFVAIDIESGNWEMDADEILAGDRLLTREPISQTWMIRIGFAYLRRFGAGRSRTAV